MADIPCISKIVVRSKWKDVSQAPSTVLTNEELTKCSAVSLPLFSTCLGLSLPTCLLNTAPWMSWPWLLWFRALWIGQASRGGVIDSMCLPPRGTWCQVSKKLLPKRGQFRGLELSDWWGEKKTRSASNVMVTWVLWSSWCLQFSYNSLVKSGKGRNRGGFTLNAGRQ